MSKEQNENATINEEMNAMQSEIEQLRQALEIERENNRLLETIVIRLSGKFTGVI